MDPSGRLGDRDRLEVAQHVLDERSPPRPTSTASTVDAVERLAHGSNADRALLTTEHVVDPLGAALVIDQHVSCDRSRLR